MDICTQTFLKNGEATVAAVDSGAYCLQFPGFELTPCRSALIAGDGETVMLDWKTAETSSGCLKLECANSLGEWFLEFRPARNRSGLRGLSLKFGGLLKHIQPRLQIRPLLIDELPADHLLSQGAAMGGCRSIRFPIAQPPEKELSGHYILVLRREKQHLQISTPLRQKLPVCFRWETIPNGLRNFKVAVQLQHNDIREIECDPVELFCSGHPFDMMNDWSESHIEIRKHFPASPTAGWNSWDYYRWTVTEEEVLKNAEFIASDPVLSQHVKRIIVDDGWQYCYGEWEANPLFPNGMASLARELSKMGFEPGLWFAPTIVEPHCRIAQRDYEMLAMSDGGQPCMCYSCMERVGFVLDPTRPDVRKYLAGLFDRYAGMGYRHFKLDFLASTLNAAQFHDRSVPRSEIIRMIVQPIALAVEGRAALLGCNYNLEAGNRYVEAVRIGSDIHSTWEGIRSNAVSVAARFWSNKRHWVNDPDFALARGFGTSDDADLLRLKPFLIGVRADSPHENWTDAGIVDAGKSQIEILLSIVLMAAGAVNLSDNLPKLNSAGLDLLRRTVAAEAAGTGIPLDLFENSIPSLWLQETATGHRVLLINWGDTPATMKFDLGRHGINAASAMNFWNDEPVGIRRGTLQTDLQPRSCLLVRIR